MNYDLSNKIDENKAITRLESLIKRGKIISLKEIRKRRTINQNAYLHVIISLFSIEFGYTLDEGKTHLKRNCQFMRYEKNGEYFLKRTREMNTKELTDFIDWTRNYSSMNGCYLPTSEEYINQRFEIDREIEKVKQYL